MWAEIGDLQVPFQTSEAVIKMEMWIVCIS